MAHRHQSLVLAPRSGGVSVLSAVQAVLQGRGLPYRRSSVCESREQLLGVCASRSRSLSRTRTEIAGSMVKLWGGTWLRDRTPTRAERHYRKRSAIETSYRLFRQARATTTTRDPIVRFAFVIVSFLLESLWLVPRWAGATCPISSRSRRPVTGSVTNWKQS